MENKYQGRVFHGENWLSDNYIYIEFNISVSASDVIAS